jgi:hypothetical protein
MTMKEPFPWDFEQLSNAFRDSLQREILENPQTLGEFIERYNDANLGVKFDQDKLQWDLFPFDLAEDELRVWMFGAKKYTAHNWRKGMPMSRGFNALMRHLTAYMNGEDTDPESGESHLAHAACCLKMMQHTEKHHKELDDRMKRNA